MTEDKKKTIQCVKYIGRTSKIGNELEILSKFTKGNAYELFVWNEEQENPFYLVRDDNGVLFNLGIRKTDWESLKKDGAIRLGYLFKTTGNE